MKKFFQFLNEVSTDRVILYGAQYKAFGIFSLINYPISFILLFYYGSQANENFWLRLVAVLLALPLIITKKWPLKLQKLLPLYWHVTLIFCIPFFATFMLLENRCSPEWLMNTALGLFWFVLLVDWLTFIVLTIIGNIFGLGVFFILRGLDFNFINEGNESFLNFSLYMYVYAIVLGLIFSRNKTILEHEKNKTTESLAGAIAHEMRTPLANVTMSARSLDRTAQNLENAISLNSAEKDQFLREESAELRTMSQRLDRIAKGSQNFINLLLTNLRQDFKNMPFSTLSLKECVEKALEEFSFKAQDRSKVEVEYLEDFSFKGNKELFIHVLFNLIHNSLYFIQAAGKGEIFITFHSEKDWNVLEFKDTGPGIEAHLLPHLFKPFYSRRPHGTGIGLSFCKKAMESMDGRIEVSSELGEYTTFTLQWPKIATYTSTDV